MNDRYFDAVARTLVSGEESRRGVLRLLAGTALGGLVARLGQTEGVVAKPKRKRRADQQPQDALQTEGKRKKKKRGKKPDKKPRDQRPLPPLPPGCQNCGTCQMCQDGACVWDPDLWLVRCLDSPEDPGGQCHVCHNGACTQRANGSSCADGDDCSWCQDGQCVPMEGKKRCGEACIDANACCPEDDPCSPCQQSVCENGTWVCEPGYQEYCPPLNWYWDFETCQCECKENYEDCGVRWENGRIVGRCSCFTGGGNYYCNEEKGLCCPTLRGCDP